MKRSHLSSIRQTFQFSKKCSWYLIPKYRSSCHQKNIPYHPCKVQHTPINWLLRRLHTEITPEVLSISARRLENFGLSWQLWGTGVFKSWSRNETSNPGLYSKQAVLKCHIYLQGTFWALTCTASSVLYSQVQLQPWFITQYLRLPGALLKPWFMAGLRESIQIKHCSAKPSPFWVSQYRF